MSRKKSKTERIIMIVKDFIDCLRTFDENKIVFIDGIYENSNGKIEGCITGLQPQDIKENGYIYSGRKSTSIVDIYFEYNNTKENNSQNFKVTTQLSKTTTGMTVKEVIEFFSKFKMDSEISLPGCYDGEDCTILSSLRRENIFDWNNNVLISDYYSYDKETMYVPIILDRVPFLQYISSNMTVTDLKNWLNQFDGNMPVMIENGCGIFHLNENFIESGTYTNEQNNSVKAIFISGEF